MATLRTRNIRRIFGALELAALIAMSAGCKKGGPMAGDPIVGSWIDNIAEKLPKPGMADVMLTMKVTYRDNGTFTGEFRQTQFPGVASLHVVTSGTWSRIAPNRYREHVLEANAFATGTAKGIYNGYVNNYVQNNAQIIAHENSEDQA